MTDQATKQLLVTAVSPDAPDPGPPDIYGRRKVLLEYNGEFLGSLSLATEDFADFLLAIRDGFSDVIIRQA